MPTCAPARAPTTRPASWLATATAVAVTGRNADATWLRIEHDGRTGWIFGALTDIAAEVLADLPDTAPADLTADEPAEPTPEPAVVAEPTPEPAAPEPPAPSDATSVTVTGSAVNLRTGPGTDHPTDGQVRAGDQLSVTGRNADSTWLQVMHPVATGELVWIYGPLTDIDDATVRTLTDATAVAIEVAASPEPAPALQPAAQPEPAPADPQPAPDLSGCTQFHTVNPNEEYLVLITDWFGLDLATVANLNGLDPNTPLVAGTQVCLSVGTQVAAATTPAPAPQPAPVIDGQACLSSWGSLFPCPGIPNHPEHAVKSVEGVPVLYHAPGSYDRSEHPGLEYDFELVLGDDSTMWNWRMRDPQACYDALRVHMGEIPESIGLTRLEVRLSDSPLDMDSYESLLGMQFSSGSTFPVVDWDQYDFESLPPDRWPNGGWPNWDLADLPHPDMASVRLRCYDRPRGRPDDDVFCRIFPRWGNSGSIHLEAGVTQVLALTAGQMSRRARAYQYAPNHLFHIPYHAYLYPLIDDRSGNPAGPGPCMEVTRAE